MYDDDSTIEEWIETTASEHKNLSSPRISGFSSTTSSQASVISRRSGATSPSKRAILRALPQSIHLHTYREPVVHLDAPLGFKELVDKILDYAEGLSTVPDEFKVRSLHTKQVTPHPALLTQPVFV
jgi:hypothetical protein